MAGTNSNYTEKAQIDWLLLGASVTRPATLSVALFTVNPDFETGLGGTEATGGGYVRKSVTFNAATSPGGSTSSSNSQQWTVGTDIAAGTYTGWAVYDNGGNMLFGDTFGAQTKVLTSTGDTLTFAAGAITYTLT